MKTIKKFAESLKQVTRENLQPSNKIEITDDPNSINSPIRSKKNENFMPIPITSTATNTGLELEKFEKVLDFGETSKKFFQEISEENDEEKDEENLFEIKEEEEKSPDYEKVNQIEKTSLDDSRKLCLVQSNNNHSFEDSDNVKEMLSIDKKQDENEALMNAQSMNNMNVSNRIGGSTIYNKDDDDLDIKSALINDDLIDNVKSVKYRDDPQYRNIKYILFPDDDFKIYWNIFLIMNLGFVAILLPYNVAFDVVTRSDLMFFFDMISLCIFWIDIIITFFAAYYDKNEDLIINHKAIAYNYIFGWFLFDFITAFPFGLIDDYSPEPNESFITDEEVFRLLSLIRILKLFKERSRIVQYLQVWTQLKPGIETFFFTMASFFVFVHIAACIWYLIARQNPGDHSNWLYQSSYLERKNQDIYIASFYFVMQTIVTVGYGDLHPYNTIERIISLILMFVGAFIYSLNVGTLSNILSTLDSKEAYVQENLDTLTKIKNIYDIDNILYNRIKRALKYGHSKTDEQRNQFLNELPINLRIELAHIMYKNMLVGIDFFNNKNQRFIAFIGPLLKPLKVGKGEYIFTEGEYANEMYFIKSGTVFMVMADYNDFPFMEINQGYYFGEVDLFFNDTRQYTSLAETDCELLCITKKNFKKIFFHEFRDVGGEIYQNALKRKIRMQDTYEEALKFCQKNFVDDTECIEDGPNKKKNDITQEKEMQKSMLRPATLDDHQDVDSINKNMNDIDIKKAETKIFIEEEDDLHQQENQDYLAEIKNSTPKHLKQISINSRRPSTFSDNGKPLGIDPISQKDIDPDTKKMVLLSGLFKKNNALPLNLGNPIPTIFNESSNGIMSTISAATQSQLGDTEMYDKFMARLDKLEECMKQVISIFEVTGLAGGMNSEANIRLQAMKQSDIKQIDNVTNIEPNPIEKSQPTDKEKPINLLRRSTLAVKPSQKGAKLQSVFLEFIKMNKKDSNLVTNAQKQVI